MPIDPGRFVPLNPSPSSGAIPLAPAGALAPHPYDNFGGGEPGGPGVAGSTTSSVGAPGVGPTDGTETGIGALSGSQAFGSFMSGLPGGIIGQSLGSALGISPSLAGLGGKVGVTALGMLGGFPTAPFGFANSLLGGLASLAGAAQASVGPRGPSPISLSDSIRGRSLNAIDEPAIPDVTFDVPDSVAYPDMDVTFPDVTLADMGLPDDGGVGISDGGNTGVGLGEGGDSGGVGGVWQHGGPVHGPPGRDQVPGHLTTGEFVIDADSARRFPGAVRALNAWEPGDTAPRGLAGLGRRRSGA